VGLVLLAWNGVAALYANPFSMTQGYDGTQYQLLARNRLNGHDEVGDSAHTVRTEGRHPMWRPGLVWIEECLARCLGSVRTAAGFASALGTTLMELAMLCLTWRCFGGVACAVAFVGILTPLTVSALFLRLAVGQGPECWAAAAILAGLAMLIEAARRPSFVLALAGGAVAGLSEWFRSGNILLFAVPCAVYTVAALWRRPRWACGVPAVAVVAYAGCAAATSLAVPSPVDKTLANVWANEMEHHGLQVTDADSPVGPLTYYLGGFTIAPGTAETYYDHIVRCSRAGRAAEFYRQHGAQIVRFYLGQLWEVVTYGAVGLRKMTGEILLTLFLAQLVLAVAARDGTAQASVALAGGALVYWLGPVVLLRGAAPTHYLNVTVPLIAAVAAGGAVRVASLFGSAAAQRHLRARSASKEPVPTAPGSQIRAPGYRLLFALWIPPVACLSISFYSGALATLRSDYDRAAGEQAAVDALGLEGRKVACRCMTWFVDRNVITIMLPYATVPELEDYARANGLHGILIKEEEPYFIFRVNPYGSVAELDRALRASSLFGPPQRSGRWFWYPVCDTLTSRK
jgi:hypothetical protein